MRRAAAWLRQDLDAFEEATHDLTSPVKVQLAGPYTLAASVELVTGERSVSDHGARRDLVAAFAEAAAGHVAEVRRRLPHAAAVLLQVDEPSLTAVLQGGVPTASGYRSYRSVGEQEVRAGLSSIVAAVHAVGGAVALHSCADDVPLRIMLDAGPDALSVDLAALVSDTYDTIGEAIDGGTALLLGTVRADAAPAAPLGVGLAAIRRWWSDVGFAAEGLSAVAITPTCGVAGATPTDARSILARCRDLATALLEDPDGDHRTHR